MDFVIEYAGTTIAMEVRYKGKLTLKDAENILFFMQNSNCEMGFIVYRGAKLYHILKNIWAVPVEEV